MKALKSNQKEMLETEIKNSFNGLLSTLEMAKKRISKFEDRSMEISQLKYKEEKENYKQIDRSPKEVWDSFIMCKIYICNIRR